MTSSASMSVYSSVVWRRQIMACRDPQLIAARKGFAAASLIDQSGASPAFVDINNLLVVLVYEDCVAGTNDLHSPLRFVGYRVSRVPHGVRWGGADNNQLFKDLTLMPKLGARGQRIDRSKAELLRLALRLDRRLSRAARHPAAPRRGLRLPEVWAGFTYRDACDLQGEGPEFEMACRRQQAKPESAFRAAAIRTHGLMLFPLNWVSGQLERAAALFAKVTSSVQRQVFKVEEIPAGLRGFDGASEFDFYVSRFRREPSQASRLITDHAMASGSPSY